MRKILLTNEEFVSAWPKFIRFTVMLFCVAERMFHIKKRKIINNTTIIKSF